MDPATQVWLAAGAEALPQAVFLVDTEGAELARNAAAREAFGGQGQLPEAIDPATGHAVDWPAKRHACLQGALSGVIRQAQLVGVGGRRILADIHVRPIEAAEARAVLIVVEDVSERAAMERRLAVGERLAAGGQFAGRLAHELNNPLDGIQRYVGLARRVAGDGAQNYLANAQQGLARMAEILRDMLGRTEAGQADSTPVNLLLEEAITVMLPLAEAHAVVIAYDFDSGLHVPVSGRLFQVFCNLIRNALDAMPRGGRLTVHLRMIEGDCRIEFLDTGGGIPEGESERIFLPFHTTKDGSGAGLGLTVSRAIVEALGGSVVAATAPGGGAVVTVCLPASADGDQTRGAESGSANHRSNAEGEPTS